MRAPAAKAHTVLIAVTAKSLAVAYRKRVKNETLASGKWSCRSMISASSSCLEELERPFSSGPDDADMLLYKFQMV
jgi:hypothetical protein